MSSRLVTALMLELTVSTFFVNDSPVVDAVTSSPLTTHFHAVQLAPGAWSEA